MTEDIEVEKFKELILDMYKGFPNWRFYGKVEEVIKTENDRNQLIKHGFLLEEDTDRGKMYGLGANSLSLVSAWKTEELTRRLEKLTWLVLLFGLAAVVISIIGLVIR